VGYLLPPLPRLKRDLLFDNPNRRSPALIACHALPLPYRAKTLLSLERKATIHSGFAELPLNDQIASEFRTG
jgi:hypothetical protein